jgi:hypothetical protein
VDLGWTFGGRAPIVRMHDLHALVLRTTAAWTLTQRLPSQRLIPFSLFLYQYFSLQLSLATVSVFWYALSCMLYIVLHERRAMPPLPLQLRLEDYQVEAIDAVREVRNHGTGFSVRLSRQQVISGIIDQWIAAHAEPPPGPSEARVIVPPPEAVEVLGQLAAEVAAAAAATVEPSPETPPVEAAPETTALQQRVLDVIPLANDRPQGMRRKEIMTRTGLSETAVDSTLHKLHQRGHISRVGKGQYVRLTDERL